MAKQSGAYTITGTIDDLCFYKMDGKFYVRQKSSLTGKRVKTDVAFSNTMQHANLLGKASKIASVFYRTLAEVQKAKGLYKKLTGMVMQLLKEGKNEHGIARHLQQVLFPEPVKNNIAVVKHKDSDDFANALLEVIFAKPAAFVPVRLKDYGFV